jgi:large subunit ribosomal protein L30
MEKLIAIIRISGLLGKTATVEETLSRLRLRRKYCCVVIRENEQTLGSIKRVKDFIAYGPINEETLSKLIKARGMLIGKAQAHVQDSDKIVKEFISGKKLQDLGVKPYFRLHPPRKGIDSRLHFGRRKGVLGNNKEKINELIERML